MREAAIRTFSFASLALVLARTGGVERHVEGVAHAEFGNAGLDGNHALLRLRLQHRPHLGLFADDLGHRGAGRIGIGAARRADDADRLPMCRRSSERDEQRCPDECDYFIHWCGLLARIPCTSSLWPPPCPSPTRGEGT